MITFLAEVDDTTSIARNGTFLAKIVGRTNTVVVTYVSPFGANGLGGFVSLPTRGQEILVCKLSEDNGSWYYLGSTFSPPRGESDDERGEVIADQAQPLDHLDPALYRATGKPMRYTWKSPLGHTFLMSDEYNPDFFNTKIEMRSSLGKSLRLVDSPKVDSVILENEHKDSIKITGATPSLPASPRSIELTSKGPQRLTSLESQIDILVNDGRELNIVNKSAGTNKNPDEPEKYGNVNVESSYRDINLRAFGESSKIFIECLNPNGGDQLIEIETNGEGSTIRLHSQGSVEIKAAKNIDLNAGGEIRLSAQEDIKIVSGQKVKAHGQAGINLDGVPMHLNNGDTSELELDLVIGNNTDKYEDESIY